MFTGKHIFNKPAPGAPYFTPLQDPASGTAVDPQPDGTSIPKLFTPLKIRNLTFHNRIFLAPLCQYSAENGHITPWHLAHLGGIIYRGPGLSIFEGTSVLPNGRITPEDVGIWDDTHITGLRQLVEFAHSQNQKIGIQLTHSGRKASTVAPWLAANYPATSIASGFGPSVGPSAIAFAPVNPIPHELTQLEIADIVKAWAAAAKRAVQAGFDVIEIHNAHGYLLNSFISPVANKRTDEYGGSFENRIRLTLEVVDAIRGVIPEGMPLFLRISASDRLEHLPSEPSWTNEDTIKLTHILASHGVDFIDVSSGGNSTLQDVSDAHAQQRYAHAIKDSVIANSIVVSGTNAPLVIGTVGGITSGVQAEGYLQDGTADVVLVGRYFQKNPGLVWAFAENLGCNIYLAHQISWGFFGRGPRKAEDTLGGKLKNLQD